MRKKIFMGALTVLTMSCTNDFADINTNPNNPTQEQAERDGVNISGYLGTIQNQIIPTRVVNGVNLYQTSINMMGDSYVGYMAPPSNKWNGGRTMITGYMAEWWMKGNFDGMFTSIITSWRNIKEKTIDVNSDDISARALYEMAMICRALGVLRATDMFGPLPLSNQGKGLTEVPYDSVESIYNQLFQELTIASEYLKNFRQSYTLPQGIRENDFYFGGDLDKWVRFANSIRLRMAVRIRYVNPTKAQEEAQKALDGGVMEDVAHMAKLQSNDRLIVLNSLEVIADDYADTRMGATILSYMKGYQDPRLQVYFKLNPKEPSGYVNQQQLEGIRAGYVGKNEYLGFGYPNVREDSPTYVMKPSEVYFLRAEAKLFGLTSDPKSDEQLYREGIEMSFMENNVSGSGYTTNNTNTPATYSDPLNSANTHAAPSNITVAYNGSNEQKLEKIITQKYLAIFPDGHEAWTEWRRTGYPQLINPVQYNADATHGNTIISTDGRSKGVRRAIYPQAEYTGANRQNLLEGVQLLGAGAVDDCNTRLWWDANPAVR